MVKKKETKKQNIYVAFRFHVNFYHSYRNDTLTENGIGKDVRVISHIIQSLNVMNAKGIDCKGAWDIENYYSLEKIMPERCPELIEKLKDRKRQGDEIEAMSYNNGLLTALNNEECEYVLKNMIKNDEGSGLSDIFGNFAPIIRPQECMMSPSLISMMRSVGLTAVSLFYSSVPFTSFTNFISPLSTKDRYNPIIYKNPNTDEKITVIPCVNNGDIMSMGGITNYIKNMKRKQRLENTGDLLLLIDMDADDEFWFGYVSKIFYNDRKMGKLTKGGIYHMIEAAARIKGVKFTTPYEYLKTHSPTFEVAIPLDLADGSYDGYSSWAEKWENTEVWKYIERARYYSYLASNCAKEKKIDEPIEISQSLKKRVLALSTTHFGLSAPVVNSIRVNTAKNYSLESLELAKNALKKVLGEENKNEVLIDNPYIYMNDDINGLLFMERGKESVKYVANGKVLSSFTHPLFNKDCIILKKGVEKMDIVTIPSEESTVIQSNFKSVENDTIKVSLLPSGAFKIIYKGESFVKRCMRPIIKYKRNLYRGEMIKSCSYNMGEAHILKVFGEIKLPGTSKTSYEYSITLVNGLSVCYFDGKIDYPDTKAHGCKKMEGKLQRTFDDRYVEVMPFEIYPEFTATDEAPFVVSKHNFFGEQFKFNIDFGTTTNNRKLDSFNNAITCGYIAVGNGDKGLLISQNVNKDTNFAFCPMKVGYKLGDYSLRLNPFGTYFGSQMRNALSKVGFGTMLAIKTGVQYKSLAPSYAGKQSEVSLMIAPFYGQTPSDSLIKTAYLHAYPPIDKNVL